MNEWGYGVLIGTWMGSQGLAKGSIPLFRRCSAPDIRVAVVRTPGFSSQVPRP